MKRLAMLSIWLALPLLLARPVHSQTVTPTPTSTATVPLFTPASYAVDFQLNGVSSLGSLTTETGNFTANFGAEAAEFLVPTLNLQGYYGGISYTPNLSGLFKNTVFANNPPTISIAGDGGYVMNNTAGAYARNPSGLVRLVFDFNISGGVTVPINVGYARVPGFGPSANAFFVTAGLAKTFNLP